MDSKYTRYVRRTLLDNYQVRVANGIHRIDVWDSLQEYNGVAVRMVRGNFSWATSTSTMNYCFLRPKSPCLATKKIPFVHIYAVIQGFRS